MTRGIYTTEFWISIGAAAASFALAFGAGDLAEPIRLAAAALGAAVPTLYAAFRTGLKKAEAVPLGDFVPAAVVPPAEVIAEAVRSEIERVLTSNDLVIAAKQLVDPDPPPSFDPSV